MSGRPRLGAVKYLNARPLIHGWNGPLELDHPAALCRRLAAGDLDAALVSSFEYLRNPIYTIVDDVAIGSDGPVYSVVVAQHAPTESIALDPASETSANLLRCILAEREETRRLAPAAPEGAQLLIGDQAIHFRQAHARDYSFWDLGEEWKRMTGLPFVFALWLVRPEITNARELAERLRRRRDANLAAIGDVIAAQSEFRPAFCARYFRENLRFGFAEREKQGLMRFRALCEKHGILSPGSGNELRLI